MGYANIQADSNFYRQSLNADGVKYVTGPYTSLYEDVFRAVTVTTDSVVSVTSYVGDSLSNQFLLAGTEIYGLFSSVTIHSGKAVLHLAGASYISEIINQYSASGIPLGFYEEGTQCLSQKISALLTQGVFDDASWVMVPSQYKEDTVRAFKPTSELGNLNFTRSSDATYTDSTGVVRRSPYNLLQQSEDFSNAAWGKASSGVAAPVVTANQSLSPTGTNTADKIVFPAVPTATNFSVVYNFTPLTTSGSNTASVYLKGEVGGEKVYVFMTVGSTWTNLLCTLTTEWQRFTFPFTGGANSYFHIGLDLRIGSGQVAQSGSTIYAWGAQLVEGSSALDYFPTTNRQDVPRIDFRNADETLSSCGRLLLEPQRTNSIRNSSMVGAVAGSPGTLPTNWGVANAGLTQTIVGIGTESGLPYIDLRFNGTASTATGQIELETFNQIAASNAQTWAQSSWFKIISQPNPPLSFLFRIREGTAAGAFVAEGTQSFTPTTTLQRFTYVRTNTGVTTERIQPVIRFTLTNGAAYDFTIRIAAPQMELGGNVSTWIPTTTAATTRTADSASKSGVSSLIGQTEGTFFTEIQITPGVSRALFSIDIGATTNYILGSINASAQVLFRVNQASTITTLVTSSALTLGRHKLAFAYKAGQYALYIDGVQSGVSTSTVYPVGTLSQIILNSASYGQFGDGYAQAALFPVRLDNAILAALTTL